jgi:hypothetical protein
MADKGVVGRSDRGAPLVATAVRWSAASAVAGAALVSLAETYRAFGHTARPLASFATVVALGAALLAALLWQVLRAEELRLARELRIARAGTSALRSMVTRRGQQQRPALWRLVSTKLGAAAMLLAEGDRDGALDAAAGGSLLMRGGRLEMLRAVVDADLERAVGSAANAERCIERLQSMVPIGNREADLYRTHVLVKALLERGDAEGAFRLVEELDGSRDEEARVYLVWLRVWFDLDADADGSWPELSEGELRIAMLLARSHGAEKLVEKLEARLAAIAHPVQGE